MYLPLHYVTERDGKVHWTVRYVIIYIPVNRSDNTHLEEYICIYCIQCAVNTQKHVQTCTQRLPVGSNIFISVHKYC